MMRRRWLFLVVAVGLVPCAFAAPRSSDEHVQRAAGMLAGGDTMSAIDVLEHSHLDDHDDPRAYILLGRVFREQGTIESRLRSQQVLENARLRFPDDSDVLVELGRTYYTQRFFPDALGCLHRALEIDAARCDARFLIGLYYYRNWKRVNQFTDDLDTSRRHLRDAWRCDPDNVEAARLYLFARYALADTSAREADQFIARYPREGSFHLYRGALAYDAGRYDVCALHFERGLSLLAPEERAIYQDLSNVLPINSLARYREIGRDAREVFRRGYWLAEDPDPTTPENERELEHIYRVFLADMMYTNDWTGKRGWNSDRGETLIKFGRPFSVDYSLGDGQDGHMETWSYERSGELRQLPFVDEFLNGDYRIPYSDDYVLHNLLHDPEFTSLQSGIVEIPGVLDVTVFRDNDLRASLYAAMRVDADTVEAHALPGSTNMYLLRGALFDENWNREGGDATTVWTSQLPPRRDAGARVLEFVRQLNVPFGAYRVAWSIQDEHNRVRALARGQADAQRFAGDALALSDVLLYDEAPPNHPKAAGLIERGGKRMRPRVDHAYTRDEPLRSYVEVYGLGLLDGGTEYQVRYSIYPGRAGDTPAWFDVLRVAGDALGLGDEDPVISQSFTRTGTAHHATEYIAIDITALEPGRYELRVEVMDLNSGQHAARQSALTVEPGATVPR